MQQSVKSLSRVAFLLAAAVSVSGCTAWIEEGSNPVARLTAPSPVPRPLRRHPSPLIAPRIQQRDNDKQR